MKTLIATLSVLLGLTSGGAHGAGRGIEHRQVTVEAANDEWTSTDLKLQQGDLLVVLATGTVTVGSLLGEVGPDGVAGTRTGEGTLQLKVGASTTFKVGSNFTVTDQVGTVKVRVSDSKYADNKGQFAVRLIQIPEDVVPPAKPIAAE